MATHLLIYEEVATSTHLFKRGWSPLPIHLGGDGHLPSYFGTVYLLIYIPTYLGENGHPTYLGGDGHIYPFIWEGMATYPPMWGRMDTYLFCLPIHLLSDLGGDGYPPIYLGGYDHLYPFVKKKVITTFINLF